MDNHLGNPPFSPQLLAPQLSNSLSPPAARANLPPATTLATTSSTLLGYMYLNARLNLHQDLRWIVGRRRMRLAFARAAASSSSISPYSFIVSNTASHPSSEAIWSRSPDANSLPHETYTWTQLLHRSNQWAAYFLGKDVKPGDLVAFFMLNSPDFVFAWIGLWAIGAAPAMINYHLSGDALVHCLKISGARLVVMDGDEKAVGRMEEVKGRLGGSEVDYVKLGEVKKVVRGLGTENPSGELRKGVKGTDPMALFYTSGTTGMPKGCALPMVAAWAHGYGGVVGTNPVEGKGERYCK